MTTDEKKYVKELEIQYNLLFDYMWTMGSTSYIKFLRNRGISILNYLRGVTRIKTKITKGE